MSVLRDMKKIVIGSKNKDKARELRALLKRSGIRVLSLEDFPGCPEAVESGKTFTANAEKKARQYSRHTQTLTLADDSGLMVSRLRGAPGVYSARFAGENCTYQDNNKKLLRLLKNVPAPKRGAKFVSVIAIYDKGRRIKTVRGESVGRISDRMRGTKGFGYDPVFIPRGLSKTYAELSPAEKSKISHRGKALRKAQAVVRQYLRKIK